MDHGAWDYAADTRGYSWGVFLEYNQPRWAIRFASVMEPIRANEIELDRNFPAARGDNLELELRHTTIGRPSVTRLLLFENHANMGNYRATLDTPAYGMDVTKSRGASVKYGAGLSTETALTDELGLFAKLAWNDGRTETWAFTEIDQSFSAGVSVKGTSWNRTDDTVAVALGMNGLSQDHRDYLASGGLGFMLGDGRLNYAPEEILECYYRLSLKPGLQATGDYQFINHPAYNADRGPVTVLSVRMHLEI